MLNREEPLTVYLTYAHEGPNGRRLVPPLQVHGMKAASDLVMDRLLNKRPGSKAEIREGYVLRKGRGALKAAYEVAADGAVVERTVTQ